MPRAKKKTKIDKSASRKDWDRLDKVKIIGNFRGSEDIFWTKVVRGFKKFCEPAFK